MCTDLRARAVEARTVSYPLPRSLNELFKLEHGRRKAYEVRRRCTPISKLLTTDIVASRSVAQRGID